MGQALSIARWLKHSPPPPAPPMELLPWLFLQRPERVPAPFQASSSQGVTFLVEGVCVTVSQTGGKGRVHSLEPLHPGEYRTWHLVPTDLGPFRPLQALRAICFFTSVQQPLLSWREGTVSEAAGPCCPHHKGTAQDCGW